MGYKITKTSIVSLSFAYPLFSDLQELKKSYLKIQTVIEKERDKLLRLENHAVEKNERLRELYGVSTRNRELTIN